MVKFTAPILSFAENGDKTGWSYVAIPADIAHQLKPGNKKAFRVKGKLDNFSIQAVALLPMGGGGFILPINADMRKGTGKRKGATLTLQLTEDKNPQPVSSPELMECLADEPEALAYFNGLTMSHRNYFMKWIESAKTAPTKAKRIAQAVTALAQKQGFSEMIRAQQRQNKP
ncbi:MAG TPA: YdeI/OmpD-associated family protein [Chitinophaga sp.]|uniref:YdeI/OmpD-associated family protein n=1 Tax=Chitinophaga sp. TaxID=1869181 RepID=UPI002DBD0BB4|nr:YdeI/OmpD-associated family protein [Chitinophaga sp.]HEU4552941.1 YdeI/OmpD-associated family protein [Chitinophaga sp.]